MKIPGPEFGITDLIDYEIKALLEDNGKDKKKYFPLRPSSAGHCSRKLAYELMSYRGYAEYEIEPKEPHVYRLLNLGHSIEFSYLKSFELCKPWFQIKYKQNTVDLFRLDSINKKEQELIEGSVDAVLYAPDWKGVIDIKSTKDRFSVGYKTGWDEKLEYFASMDSLKQLSETAFYADDLEAFLDELYDPWLGDNFWQLNSYCCADFFKNRGIEFGSICKYNKNDSRHYEIRFKPSQKLFKELQNKYNVINKAVAKKKPESVEREYVLGSLRCAYCPYSKECWQGKNALKEFYKKTPKKWPTDLYKLKNAKELRELFTEFLSTEKVEKEKKKLEEKIISLLLKEKEGKVKLDSKEIFIVKELKSGLVLRRTKL